MAHEYVTDLPKNIDAYRKNQQLITQKQKENTILERRIQRLENLDEYYKRGERAKRVHRLITKGAAIESIWPGSKEMEDADFYRLMQKILTLPDANALRKEYQESRPSSENGAENGDDG